MRNDALTPHDRADLLTHWQAAFGLPPPSYLSLGFMAKALAYGVQCKRAGGLSMRASARVVPLHAELERLLTTLPNEGRLFRKKERS